VHGWPQGHGTGFQVRHRILSLFVHVRETRKGILILAHDSIYRKYCSFSLSGIEAAAVACDLAPASNGNGTVKLYPQKWNAARWAKEPMYLEAEKAEKYTASGAWATEPVVGVIPFTR
jgi:hypothetical protein